MKYSTGGGEAEVLCGPVDSLLLSSCWGGDAAGGGGGSDGHFLDMEPDDDSSTKATMDALDSLLLTCGGGGQVSPQGSSHGTGTNSNLAELKPLPPFTGYTGHLSINGIPGHHYHAIAAAPPQSPGSPDTVEANNNNTQVANNNGGGGGGGGALYKSSNATGATLYYTVTTTSASDQAVVSSSTADGIKSEFVDYAQLLPPDIEDIAAIIGSAIADTTVSTVEGMPGEDPSGSRDSWMDLGSWIDNACGGGGGESASQGGKAIISAETLQEFVANAQFVNAGSEHGIASSTLHGLLTQSHHHHHHHHHHQQQQQQQQSAFQQPMQQMVKREPGSGGHAVFAVQQSHMPLLQRRLQNGPPNGSVKPEQSYMSECTSPSSSTSYLSGSAELILPHTTTGSPPGQHVVSTTDNSALLLNGRYRAGYMRSLKASGGVASPDLLLNGGSVDGLVSGSGLLHGNYPHTTTATTTTPSKSRNRNRSRKQQQHQQQSLVYSADGSASLLGKEKPVHRCTICNRGFLNKSNIKVHLRTHTGEKPFKCEVCGKAFRQKAHLIKHQQIHKRVGRD